MDFYVDGPDYFGAIEREIENLLESDADGRYFYLSAWWLGLIDVDKTITINPDIFGADVLENFTDAAKPWPSRVRMDGLRLLRSGQLLCDALVAMSKERIDIRVLSWVSPFAPKYKLVADRSEGIATLNLHTLLSTRELRRQFGQSGYAMLNMLSHPLGGAHLKVVVCGDKTSMRAYTGGMDPVQSRASLADWHDAAVCVDGPAAAATYQYFRQLWNEQRTRKPEVFILDDDAIPSHLDGTPEIPLRSARPAQNAAGPCVQVLRTIPRMNFSLTGPEWLEPSLLWRTLLVNAMGFKKDPLSFAPQGIFEFKAALRKMISAASKYIFITDQCFSSQEILSWLNGRLIDGSGVKVILLHGPDPADPPSGSMQEAVDNYLLAGVEKSAESASGFKNLACYKWTGTVAHSKVIIVDDMA